MAQTDQNKYDMYMRLADTAKSNGGNAQAYIDKANKYKPQPMPTPPPTTIPNPQPINQTPPTYNTMPINQTPPNYTTQPIKTTQPTYTPQTGQPVIGDDSAYNVGLPKGTPTVGSDSAYNVGLIGSPPINQTPIQIQPQQQPQQTLIPYGSNGWYLSGYDIDASGNFKEKPQLVISNKVYQYNTPQEYLNELIKLRDAGASKNINKEIEKLTKVISSTGQQPQQPQQTQNNMVALRDIIPNIGWNAATGNVTIEGKEFTPQQLAQFGLQNINGRWSGTPETIGAMFGLTGVRNFFESQGVQGNNITYTNGRLAINGIPIPTSATDKLVNIGGRLFGDENTMQFIQNIVGGNNVAGNMPRQDGGQVGQGFFDEQNKRIDNLQKSYDESMQLLKDIKPPDMSGINNQIAEYIKQISVAREQTSEQIKNILAETFKEFNYNPNADTSLQKAIKFADESMMEEMNARGILNSTVTADRSRVIREELIPKYEQIAWERYNQNIGNQLKKVNLIEADYDRYVSLINNSMNMFQNISSNTWKIYENNLELANKKVVASLEKQKSAITVASEQYKDAMERIDKLGYVDNEASLITGIPVNTPSQKAREYNQNRLDKLTEKAIEMQVKIDERKENFENDMIKIKENQKVKEQEEIRKSNAGNLRAFLAQFSPDDALNYVTKNYAKLSPDIGSELTDIVIDLQDLRQKGIDTSLRMRADNRAAAASDRAAAASERAARNEERRISNEEKQATNQQTKQLEDAVKDFKIDIRDTIKEIKTKAKDIGSELNINYWNNTYSAERKEAFDFIMREARNRGFSPEIAAALAKEQGLSEFLN